MFRGVTSILLSVDSFLTILAGSISSVIHDNTILILLGKFSGNKDRISSTRLLSSVASSSNPSIIMTPSFPSPERSSFIYLNQSGIFFRFSSSVSFSISIPNLVIKMVSIQSTKKLSEHLIARLISSLGTLKKNLPTISNFLFSGSKPATAVVLPQPGEPYSKIQ